MVLHQFHTQRVQFQFLPTQGLHTFPHHLRVQEALLLAHPMAVTIQVLPLAATTRQLLTLRHLVMHPSPGMGLLMEASSNLGELLFGESLSLCYFWLYGIYSNYIITFLFSYAPNPAAYGGQQPSYPGAG